MSEENTNPKILEQIIKAAEYFSKAHSILFITGAGVSAESGLPTYRGIGGLYNEKNTDDNIPIEVALSGDMMRRRPELTWKYLYQIEESARNAHFNAAHKVMADLETTGRRICVLTQNIDGFHEDAGSTNVIEMHGNFRTLMCTSCGQELKEIDYSNLSIPPRCPECKTIMRPNVVLFGEMLPEDAVEKLTHELHQGFDLVVSAGTTSVFPYIAGPVKQAYAKGIPTIEINPSWTEVSSAVTVKIEAPAGITLEKIWDLMEKNESLQL